MILTEEQRLIRDMARQFAESELRPHVAEWDRQAHTPREVLARMGSLGLMGVCVPQEWGGAGADFIAYATAMEEMAAVDGGIANLMAAHNSPVCAVIMQHGSDAQKQRFLRPLALGQRIGAFLLTEPQAGSDAANLLTRAERRGDQYVLNGSKQFITGGRTADIALIVAVTDPDAGKRGITCFITATDVPGYEVARVEHKLGHRTNDTCAIALRELEIPVENVLGPLGRGYGIALANLSNGRIGVAAQAVGNARAAYEATLAYAQEREAFGKPIIEHQAVGFMLADMAMEIEAGRQIYLHAAAVLESGAESLKEASMAKLYASEMAERVASAAIQIHGGYGFLNDFPVEKIYRDQRVLQLYEGTSEIQKLVIARAIAAL